ncbi:MAG: 8-oxo-dGTP diphosphatase [Lachnospiraceae bacterium]|nr:8-oxo-dGTP diphosphatase [Lachnospiraceae bacterium]
MPGINTTLCYIEREGQYLMLLRNKKKQDLNEGKWIGVGGKFEANETPEECLLREVKEETGLTLTDYRYRGVITFVSDTWETEYMHLFTATGFEGELMECDEGELRWIPKEEVLALPLWEGDRQFLHLLYEDAPFFTMKVVYHGDELVETSHRIYE